MSDEEKQEVSENTFHRTRRILFYGGSGVKCCTIIFLPLWIAILAVGAVHINNCRLNPMIPRWMIVFASAILIGITLDVLSFVWDAIYNYKRKVEERRYLNIFNILGWLVQLFYFAWVIVGTVWVLAYYGAWTHGGGQSCTTNPANPLCCEASVYLFSFVIIIFEWIALLLAVVVYVIAIILGICCISCISALGASAYKNLSGGD